MRIFLFFFPKKICKKTKYLYTISNRYNIAIGKMFRYGNLYGPVNPEHVRVVGLPRELVCEKPYKIHLTFNFNCNTPFIYLFEFHMTGNPNNRQG